MKTFWPTFWATLAEILVAAAIIYGVKLHIDSENRLEAIRSETRAREREAARIKEQRESDERRSEKLYEDQQKRAAEYRKAHGLPEPIYPTLDEAFASACNLGGSGRRERQSFLNMLIVAELARGKYNEKGKGITTYSTEKSLTQYANC